MSSTSPRSGGSGPNDVYVADLERIFHSTGDGTWTLEVSANTSLIDNFATLGAGRMFAGNELGMMYRDPSTATWSFIGACASPNYAPGGAGAGGDVAVAGFHAYTYDEDSLCTFDDLVDVAPGGVDGGTRTVQTFAASTVESLFASATGRAYALGYGPNGPFASYAVGDGWASLTVPDSVFLFANGAAYGDTMWALDGRSLYRSTAYGPLVLEQAFAPDETIGGIWAAGEDELWMSGTIANSTCELLHLQAGVLTRFNPPGAPGPCYVVWGASPREIYAVSGSDGSLVHVKF